MDGVQGKTGGSFVALVSGASPTADITLVVETMEEDVSACAYGNAAWKNVSVPVDNPTEFCFPVSVCSAHPDGFTFFLTSLETDGSGVRFQQQPSIKPTADCCFMISLKPNSLYTISTTTGASHGSGQFAKVTAPEGIPRGCGYFDKPLARTPFPLPYATSFDLRNNQQVRFMDFPAFLSDLEGVFRVGGDPWNSSASCLYQRVLAPSSRGVPFGVRPTTALGDKTWTNVSVEVTARLADGVPDDAFVAVYARIGHGFSFGPAGGYGLSLYANSTWTLSMQRTDSSYAVLAYGTHSNSPREGWRTLTLVTRGSKISASIDGLSLARVVDNTWSNGLAGVGSGYHYAYFRYLSVIEA